MEWGGDLHHTHDRIAARNGRGGSGSPGKQTVGSFPSDLPAPVCSCGAVRVDSQIGLEPTPAEFVAEMVSVFREVRRVLRDDGTLWLNLGDSYNSIGGGYQANGSRGSSAIISAGTQGAILKGRNRGGHEQLKPKDLMGIPWHVAFALQADGWYLRQDIIWSKPNPMPESVTDRCTKSHEYLFLLSKSERYYFDADAIAEPISAASVARLAQDIGSQAGSSRVPGKTNGTMKAVGGRPGGIGEGLATRNKRSVWTVATQPFSEAHFATFPAALIEPCILAGSPKCGVVLDPFGGAGTTAMVADRLGRDAVSIELNPEYADMQRRRLLGDGGMFTEIAAE